MDTIFAAILGNARAFVEALTRLPPVAGNCWAHSHFGHNFNELRRRALEAAPGLDPGLLGENVEFVQTNEGVFTRATYVEIEVYARQIMEQFTLLRSSLDENRLTAMAADAIATGITRVFGIEGRRQSYPNANTPWPPEEEQRLRSRYLEGALIDELVREFGRSPGGIESRLALLGLPGSRFNLRPNRRGDSASPG